MTLNTPIGRLRILAILEGVSYLLLFITMPLKYWLGYPLPNYIVGMAHGCLFILYVIIAIQNILIYQWRFRIAMVVLGASLIPFATFHVDHTILKHPEGQSANQK